jgi:hypothetical protein
MLGKIIAGERSRGLVLTRVNSTNVLDEGLRIGEIGRCYSVMAPEKMLLACS